MENTNRYYKGDAIGPRLDRNGTAVFAYWNALRGDRPYPRKSQFDPMQVPKALPGMLIVERAALPVEFQYRLVGTAEVDARGRDPTGEPVANAYIGPDAETALFHYRSVLETGKPMCVEGVYRLHNHIWVEDVSLYLPMADVSEDPEYIFVYSYQKPYPGKDRSKS